MSTASPSARSAIGQCLNTHRRPGSTAPPARRAAWRRWTSCNMTTSARPPHDRRDGVDVHAARPCRFHVTTRRPRSRRPAWQIGARAPYGRPMADRPARFLHPFARPARPVFTLIVRGEGALVWDADGNEYVDAMASLWYCAVGHGRTEIADAVAAQLRTLAAYSCFEPFTNAPADELAERVARAHPDPRRPGVPLRLGLGGRRHGDEAGPAHPRASPATPSARWSSAASAATTAPTSAARAPRASRRTGRAGAARARRRAGAE